MDTRWKKFSRSRGCKLAAFVLFVLAGTLVMEQLLLTALHFDPEYGLEPLFCAEYERSDSQMAAVQQDVVAVLNEISYAEQEHAEQYRAFLQEYGLADSLESYQTFQGNRYANWGERSEPVRYFARWQSADGSERTLGSLEEAQLSHVTETGLTYTYDGELTCSRRDVPLPEIRYEDGAAADSAEIVLVYPQEWLTTLQKGWTAAHRTMTERAAAAAVWLALSLAALFFLLAQTGRKAGSPRAECCVFDRMWTELTVLLGVAGACGCILAVGVQWEGYEDLIFWYGEDAVRSYSVGTLAMLCGGGFALGAAATLAALLSLARKLKTRCFWRTSLAGKLCRALGRGGRYLKRAAAALFCGKCFRDNRFQRAMFVRQLVFVLGEMLLCPVCGVCLAYLLFWYGDVVFLFLLFLSGLLALLLLAWYADGCARANGEVGMLCGQIARMANGELGGRLQLGENALLGETAEELNDIRGGMQKSIEAQVKSERMKIELITNVSHDLKTPLTSIISYVDLLQKEQLEGEARDYVLILARKAERLRQIVADVFDLAKATSGEAAPELEDLALRRLPEQPQAAMEDRTAASGREIRLKLAPAPAWIRGDGKKLYRVFQNLMDNALNYSMAGTRIYLEESLSEEGRAVVSVKNTASYEMAFTEEEILERFARGDKARTTEGNGLGLSIAKSFTELCGGRFSIRIDGDQFGAEASFPLVPAPETPAGETAGTEEE